ncbi:hypothetical protein CSB45_10190 [candidate division KSB3 bacterium]|uniref:TonB C-terminal domain-containing protein n=1 Tax=candidate division KSB3 bacterium TaxID=2044937 RepID=A0A2G6E418_9BACT|nr:MAG: hypothetical protein CSB45_10190 [candidate division KSB3 bacterium]PIE29316.1 MAG: hypothetical protein CSA57_08905 [candidate division KSB3 bacterium]
MNAKNLRLAVTARTNKKKRSGPLLFGPHQTFYLTFLFSILFHGVVLYSIPAVNLFSNASTREETIVVLELLQSEELSQNAEAALPEAEEHHFQAAIPEIPWDWSDANAADAAVDPEFAAAPNIAELKEDFTLMANVPSHIPDLPTIHPSTRKAAQLPSRMFRPEEPTFDKPNPEQFQASQSKPAKGPEKLTHVQPVKTPLQRNSRPPRQEEPFAFPRPLPSHTKRQRPLLADKQPISPSFEKHVRLNAPAFAAIRPERPTPSDRRIGLIRTHEDDQNRFGIFVGERFDAHDPLKTHTVPEAAKQAPDEENDVTQQAESLKTDNSIDGPVRGRALIYRPQPPKVASIGDNVELHLKFWVLPDGTIGEVVPLKRGNVQLEQIAISYLKTWRFKALSPDVPQQRIWGTIPIKFTAQ